VWFGERTHAKVFALFASESERPRLRAQISTKHHLGPERDIKLSGRLRYDASPPCQKDGSDCCQAGMWKGRLYAKKSFDLGNQTAVNVKAEVVAKQESLRRLGKVRTRSRVELSKKLLDVTDTQDVRLRCGVELESGTAYAEVRENHLQFRLDSNGVWSMLYDI
jgi:hypothetical protein